ncbi:hypothetical protein ABZS59_35980 [Streptomyces flaveolus]|jgi:hypothetical protein|uniref:hypothetical protein n=1 Tax=Streptomyces flaveolus TaxID=67297 RepID=UPI00339F84E7
MYEKPDLDTPLPNLRTNTTAWETSLDRHLSEERKGQGLAFDVQLMEEREPLTEKIIQAITTIDQKMSKRQVIDSAAPSEWTVDRLTDAQLDAVKADWPELALFDATTLRQVADVIGIRMVRDMARQALRNASAVLNSNQ